MTRARDQLHLVQPERFYVTSQARHGDRHVRAPRTRFIPNGLLRHFDLTTPARGSTQEGRNTPPLPRYRHRGGRQDDVGLGHSIISANLDAAIFGVSAPEIIELLPGTAAAGRSSRSA